MDSVGHLAKYEALMRQHAEKAFRHLLVVKGVVPTEKAVKTLMRAFEREVPAFMRRCADEIKEVTKT